MTLSAKTKEELLRELTDSERELQKGFGGPSRPMPANKETLGLGGDGGVGESRAPRLCNEVLHAKKKGRPYAHADGFDLHANVRIG